MWNRKGRRIAVYVFKTLHSPCIFLISAKFSSVFNFTSLNKNKANLISKGGETLARGGGGGPSIQVFFRTGFTIHAYSVCFNGNCYS